MFKFLRKMKGQSTLEYAILIVIIIGALLSIQVYIKRGLQGRLKSATDDIGEQYSPGNTNISATTTTFSQTRDTFAQGSSLSNLTAPETTNTNSTSNIINVQQEFWGKTP
jgi:hypothetical protein